MSRKKKQEVKQGLDEWMATYSDMVTLLLCFFVLLYASSTPDETKFQYIFQSFNSQGKYINPFVTEDYNEGDSKTDEEDGNFSQPANAGKGTSDNLEDGMGLPNNFDELYVWLQTSAANSEYSNNIEVSQTSSARINIRFNNSIMFEGDSAELLPSGREALKEFTPALKAVNSYIKSIRVQGHTAEGLSVVNDWDLSSARACSVVKFLDFQRIIDSDCYVTEGRACYDPIADNSTEEGRQQNRRVELIIIRNDTAISETEIIQDILRYDYGILQAETDQFDRLDGTGGVSSDSIQQIVDSLDDKYFSEKPYTPDENVDYIGPSFSSPIKEIPESVLQPIEEETSEEE